MADGTAKKKNPELWAKAKAKAQKKMGGHCGPLVLLGKVRLRCRVK